MKEGKKAKNRYRAFEIEEKLKDIPHGWIQWKGTDVCMDVHCKCGHLGHVDGDFMYEIQCENCGTKYSLNGHIELVEIEEAENPLITD